MSRSEDALMRLPMKMTASTRLVGGVTIVDLSGRIVLGDGSAGLRDLLRKLVSEGRRISAKGRKQRRPHTSRISWTGAPSWAW